MSLRRRKATTRAAVQRLPLPIRSPLRCSRPAYVTSFQQGVLAFSRILNDEEMVVVTNTLSFFLRRTFRRRAPAKQPSSHFHRNANTKSELNKSVVSLPRTRLSVLPDRHRYDSLCVGEMRAYIGA